MTTPEFKTKTGRLSKDQVNELRELRSQMFEAYKALNHKESRTDEESEERERLLLEIKDATATLRDYL